MKTKKIYIQPQTSIVVVEELCSNTTLVNGSIHKGSYDGSKVDEFPIKTEATSKTEYDKLWNDKTSWGDD